MNGTVISVFFETVIVGAGRMGWTKEEMSKVATAVKK